MEAASSVHAVRRRKLYEEVAARIEGMIRSGEYVSGDQLPSERELTAMFERRTASPGAARRRPPFPRGANVV